MTKEDLARHNKKNKPLSLAQAASQAGISILSLFKLSSKGLIQHYNSCGKTPFFSRRVMREWRTKKQKSTANIYAGNGYGKKV